MRSAPILLVMSVLAAAGAQAVPPPADPPASAQAELSFVAPYQILTGVSYGIDAVDDIRSVLGQRRSTQVMAGLRTVWYSCPDAPAMTGGSRLTYDFKAGQQYELFCEAGKDAVIREAGC